MDWGSVGAVLGIAVGFAAVGFAVRLLGLTPVAAVYLNFRR